MSQPIGYVWDGGALYCPDCICPIIAEAAGFAHNPARNGWWHVNQAVDIDPAIGSRLGEAQPWTMDHGPQPCAGCAVPIGRGVADRIAELVAELPCEECGAQPGEPCDPVTCTG